MSQTRLAAAGLASIEERGTTCCYAKQDKFWVEGSPDGERWEFYTVLADSSTFFAVEATTSDEAGCCTPAADAEPAAEPSAAACC